MGEAITQEQLGKRAFDPFIVHPKKCQYMGTGMRRFQQPVSQCGLDLLTVDFPVPFNHLGRMTVANFELLNQLELFKPFNKKEDVINVINGCEHLKFLLHLE